MFVIILPWPPTNNNLYAVVRGRKILSEEGRAYRGLVRVATAKTYHEGFGRKRLYMKMFVYPPDRRERDLDNLPKAVQDGLAKACVYEKDSQIDRLDIIRGPVAKPGSVRVELHEWCVSDIEIPAAVRREVL